MRGAHHKTEESDRDPVDEQIAHLRKVKQWAPINRMGKLFAFGPLVALWANNIDDRDAAAVRSLASKRDLRSLGCLLSFYNVRNRHIRETVEAAMLEMLPRAREADGLTLEAGDRAGLHKLLHSRAVDIAVVAFNSLEYIGDTTSVPHLKGIVSGKRIPRSLSYERERIQAQAAKTIESISKRISGMKAHDSLLRCASSEQAPSGDLLTPVQEPEPVAADLLLRPDCGNGSDRISR